MPKNVYRRVKVIHFVHFPRLIVGMLFVVSASCLRKFANPCGSCLMPRDFCAILHLVTIFTHPSTALCVTA